MHPSDTSHSFFVHSHTFIHLWPFVGYGHIAIHFGPIHPGLQAMKKSHRLAEKELTEKNTDSVLF